MTRGARAWPLGRLLGLFAFALITPLLGFGMFAVSRMIVTERAEGQEQLLRAVRMVSSDVERTLKRGLIETLKALAGSGALKDGDFAGFHREASAVLRGTGDAILLVDRQYNQLVNTRVPYGTPLPQLVDTENANKVFATGKPVIGDLVMDPAAQRLHFNVMVPGTIDGAVRYVLVLSPEPAMVSRIVEQQFLPRGWLAHVADRNGRIVARSEWHQDFFGKTVSADTNTMSSVPSGVVTTQDLEGNSVLYAIFSSDLSGWRTGVWVPLSVLEAEARKLWLTLAVLAVPALVVSLVAAALLGRWLARPIIAAANAAAALGRGESGRLAPCAIAEVNVVGAALAAAAEQRRRAEEHVHFLMRELAHRTKNVMAVVQAISWQTARKSLDLDDFEQRFTRRLEALGRSQDLLVKRDWQGVVIEDLVRAQLEPFLDSALERLVARGPALLLVPQLAQDLGLALHELATNSSKYGALSRPGGKIDVAWTIDNGTAGERRFRVTWLESGGPPVSSPVREGFGTSVITRSLSRGFNGKAEVEYRPEGLFWSFAAPTGDLIAELP